MKLITTRPIIVLPNGDTIGTGEPFDYKHPGCSIEQLPVFQLTANTDALIPVHEWLQLTADHLTRMVVFVSPGALTVCRHFFPTQWPDNLTCGVMGEGSAQTALGLGIPQSLLMYPSPSDGYAQDSAGFLVSIKDSRQPPEASLVIKGPRGRNTLPEGLKQLGSRVDSIEAYRRDSVIWTEAQCKRVEDCIRDDTVWYLTSSEAVEALVEQAIKRLAHGCADLLLNQLVIVTHPAIEAAAERCGFSVCVRIEPGQDALKACLDQLLLATDED